jgi:hypothetical protein
MIESKEHIKYNRYSKSSLIKYNPAFCFFGGWECIWIHNHTSSFSVSIMLAGSREYWMIYRGPGFLASYDFGSSPPPPPTLGRRRTGRLRKRAEWYGSEKSWSSINHSIFPAFRQHFSIVYLGTRWVKHCYNPSESISRHPIETPDNLFLLLIVNSVWYRRSNPPYLGGGGGGGRGKYWYKNL